MEEYNNPTLESNHKTLKEYIKEEVYRSEGVGFIAHVKARYLDPSTNAVLLIRCFQLSKNKLRRTYCGRTLKTRYGIYIGKNTRIGIGLKLPHPTGIIIGEAARIGNSAQIMQEVTIGSLRQGDYKIGLQPKLGNECFLGAGCKLLGDIELGDRVSVGANAVLMSNAPDDATCVGIPARVIEKKN